MNRKEFLRRATRPGALVVLLIGLLLVAGAGRAGASTRGLYVGSEFCAPTTTWQNNARNSGFTTLFLFTLHVSTNGTIDYNGTVVVSNGVYVGDSTWGTKLAACKTAPSSVNRIEATIGCWGATDFDNIKSLIAAQGTNSSSILYQNFLALKNAIGIDAIQYDDEATYDVSSAVAFGNIIAALGMKVTFCPYTAQSFWVNARSQLGGKVDAIYLQCYDGGAGNDPGTWISAFGGFKVQPGLWGNTDTTNSVTTKMRTWKTALGITGGFMWLNGSMPSDAPKWALAVKNGLSPLPPTGLAAVAGGGAVALTWQPVSDATSYNVKRAASLAGTYTTIAGAVTNTCYVDAGLTGGTTWYYEVSSINGTDEGDNSASVQVSPCGGSLPAGWTNQDIGSVGLMGIAVGCMNSFILKGSGSDIGGTADSFNFTSTQTGTNACMLGRVVALNAGNGGAKAGVMCRNDGSDGSPCVGVFVTESNSVCLQWRSAIDGQTLAAAPILGVAPPVWLQLLWRGPNFAAYYSTNGVSWTAAGTVSVALADNVLSGWAVTAHDPASLALALVDDVGSGAPVVLSQPTPASPTRFAGADCTFSVGVGGAWPMAYAWRQDGVALLNATNATLVLTNLATSRAGAYSVVVSNAFGTVTSSVATLSVTATAPGSYTQAILADHPIGYWPLSESSGTVARDYAGGNNAGYTNVYLNQAGYLLLDVHKSVRFGLLYTSNSLAGAVPLSFATSTNAAFSVEAWVNSAVQTNDSGLITKGTGGGGEQFNLDCGGASHAYRFFVRDASGAAHLASSSALPDNAWHHLAGVCDQRNGAVVLYIDGTNAAQGSITAGSGLLASANAVTFGGRRSSATSAYDLQYNGRMEEVAIYNSALSAAQVRTHYATVTNRPPLFAANPFSVATAYAGQAYSASIASSATDPNGDAFSYAKVGGPAWLSVSAGGALSGTPAAAAAGTNVFVVSAKDAPGLSNVATMLLFVRAPLSIGGLVPVAGSNLSLTWLGGASPYQVQTTTNLANPNWQNLGAPIGSNCCLVSPTNPAAFFRVIGQ
jgi:hypothetical protein